MPQLAAASSSNGKRPLITREFSLQKSIKQRKILHSYTVCEACRNISFDRAISVPSRALQSNAEGVHIAELGILTPENGCTSCELFYRLRIPQATSVGTVRFHLRAYSYLKYNTSISFKDIPPKLRAYDLPYLAVVAQGTECNRIALETANIGQLCLKYDRDQMLLLSPQILPRRADFSNASILIAHCANFHKKLCGKPDYETFGMKVIDCQSMTIVPAPNGCTYAALSYVWGGGRSKDGDATIKDRSSKLALKLLPRVVSDTVAVVSSLNLRYLWVDKYCQMRSLHGSHNGL